MKLWIKYCHSQVDVYIFKGKKELFKHHFDSLEQLLNNEVLAEILANGTVELFISNSAVYYFEEEYPLISKREIKSFHNAKIDKLLGFHSPPFKVSLIKKKQMISINSYHLNNEVLSIINHFKIIVRRIEILGFNRHLNDYLVFDSFELALYLKGVRCYTTYLDMPVGIIIKNLYKALEDECLFSKLTFIFLNQSDKGVMVMNQLLSRGDYEWVEG